ncbi:MAG: hypothetical protein J1F42_13360 [Lachnospiraceae bacterium]|nr:hypothetical protein [Lachnospiraceae bacterium]
MNAMVILHIIFVVLCIFYLAYRFQVRPVETIPVFLCMLILVLYALAMIRHLSWIDGVEAMVVLLFAVWLVSRGKEGRKEFAGVCIENMTHPSFIISVFLLIVIAACTLDKVVTWWDDINFWATDVKSLYYIDGFAGKYGNAAPDFGDYPPATQLMKWWFLHWMPETFREGLAFVGYYTMNMVFFLPLLRRLKGRNVPIMFALAAALWLFPSIAEVYGYEGFCADLTMACIYGGFLFAVTDDKMYSEVFYYGRLALYLSVLVLVKSIGFVWALFGIVFFFLYRLRKQDGAECDKFRVMTRARRIWTFAVVAAPVSVGGSWMVFCLLMRRITKTTTTAVRYLTTDEYGISVYRSEFANAFVKAFALLPLHKEKSIVFDLTPLGFYLCICLLVIMLYKVRILPERTGKIILWFSVVSGAVFYAVIFVAHITIFANEIQYLEASAMIASIERYGAPFTIGSLFFLSSLWIENGEPLFARDKLPAFVRRYGVYLCFIILVALTAGWRVGYYGLVGYRSDRSVKLAERASMIGEDEEMFLHAIEGFDIKNGARICYIRRGDVPRWVNNTYLSYEASPLSVVYQGVNLADAPTDWVVQEIRASHASYLYAEETDADVGVVFDELMQEGTFSCGVLYHITDDGTNMKLTQVSY